MPFAESKQRNKLQESADCRKMGETASPVATANDLPLPVGPQPGVHYPIKETYPH